MKCHHFCPFHVPLLTCRFGCHGNSRHLPSFLPGAYSLPQRNTPLGSSLEDILQTQTSFSMPKANQYMPAPGSNAEIHGNTEVQDSVSEEHTVVAEVHEDGGGDSQASNHSPPQRLQTDSQGEASSHSPTTSVTSPTSQQSARDLSLPEKKSNHSPPQPQSKEDSQSETSTHSPTPQTSLSSQQLAMHRSLPRKMRLASGQDGGASRKNKSPSSPRTKSPKKKPPPLPIHKDQLQNPAPGSQRRKSSTASLPLADWLLGRRGEKSDAELREPLTPHEHSDSESSS